VTVAPVGWLPDGRGPRRRGVVDDRGRVFSGATGSEVHDRSVRDGRVGDPALAGRETRCSRSRAWAERATRAPRGRPRLGRSPTAPTHRGSRGGRAGRVDRVHRADGRVDRAGGGTPASIPDVYVGAGRCGRGSRHVGRVSLLTIVADDVVQFIEDPARPAIAFGTVTAPVARRRAADHRRRRVPPVSRPTTSPTCST